MAGQHITLHAKSTVDWGILPLTSDSKSVARYMGKRLGMGVRICYIRDMEIFVMSYTRAPPIKYEMKHLYIQNDNEFVCQKAWQGPRELP